MVDYDASSAPPARTKIGPAYFWAPGVLGGVVFALLLLFKFSESVPNGFMSWSAVIILGLVVFVVAFVGSFAIYYLTGLKELRPGERRFNDPKRCDQLLRQLILEATHYELDDFTATQDSAKGSKWVGIGEVVDRDLIFFELYRVKSSAHRRYLLAAINREVGCEDMWNYRQLPENFTDLDAEIDRLAQNLARNPERLITRERKVSSAVTGVSEEERVESPLDVPEDPNVEEYEGES